MPVTRYPSKEKALEKLKRLHGKGEIALIEYPTEIIIGRFHEVTRREQINFCRDGEAAIKERIGDKAEWADQHGRLKFIVYFDNKKANMRPLGVLAVYVDVRTKGQYLWWEP